MGRRSKVVTVPLRGSLTAFALVLTAGSLLEGLASLILPLQLLHEPKGIDV